jgi:hypothetical protein
MNCDGNTSVLRQDSEDGLRESAMRQPRRFHQVCAGAITLLIVVGTYVGGLAAPFELQDDHRIIAPAITPHRGAVRMWLDALRLDVVEVGRFRPVNQVFDVIGPMVLGQNPTVWHALLLSIAAVVTLLLYCAGTIAFRSPLAGCVFALVTMLAPDPGPTATWYRLGPKEGWTMLFVAATLLLMAAHAGKKGRAGELAIFLLVALSALSKEPFVLLVPALLGVRVWLEARARNVRLGEAFKSLRAVAIGYGGIFVVGLCGIAYVVRSAGAHSYGGRSLALPLDAIMRVLVRDGLRAPSLAIWFIPALLVLFLFPRRVDLFGLLLLLAWIVPQYAMYSTRGGLWDHYWIPCIVGFAALNAGAFAVLARDQRSIGFKIAAVAAIVWTANAVRIDGFAVSNFVRRASVQQAAVRAAAAHADPGKVLVIVSNYRQESERADAFAEFVRFDGGRYRRVLMYDSACSAPCAAFPVIDRGDVGTVAFLDPDRPAPVLGSWYPETAMERITVSADQLYLSARRRGIARQTFSLAVAVRRPERPS